MNGTEPILSVAFFRTASGNEPVREWLKSFPREERRIIGEDIKTVQFGWPLGMPLVRKLDKGLWEVRSRLPGPHRARHLHRGRWPDDFDSRLHQEIAEDATGRFGTGENAPATATIGP